MDASAFDRQVRVRGFDVDGQRVPLIGPQGIFKPAVLPEMPLSVATGPEVEGRRRPYDDGVDEAGILNYRYRGTDPRHRDNAGLRLAMERGVPLVYLRRPSRPIVPDQGRRQGELAEPHIHVTGRR